MKRGTTALYLALLGAWCIAMAARPARAAVSVEASVDTSSALIGDVITYELMTTYDEGDSVAEAPHGINLYSFFIRDYRRIEPHRLDDGRWRKGAVYEIAAYRPGLYVIPPVPLAYRTSGGRRGELVTQPLTVEIRGMGVGDDDSLRVIKGSIEIPAKLQTWVWLVIGGLAAGLAVAVAIVVWRRKRDGEAGGEPREPVVVDELAEFDRIPAAEMIAEGRVRELYFLVSEALRRYIGRRYLFDAMERTLLELHDEFERANLDPEEARLFLDFLARCELVKFAKFLPPDDETATLVERAKDIVRRTQIVAEPDEPESAELPAPAGAEGEEGVS